MATYSDIRRMLEQFVKKNAAQAFLVEGTIKAVNDDQTCDVDPLDGGATYLDVRLLPLAGAADVGFITYPKKDTNVIIAVLSETEACLIMCQEIESMKLFVGDQFKLEIKDNGDCVFNGGDNGGLIIIDKLKQEVDKNSQILQTILNILQTPINETGNGVPSAFQAALNIALQGKQTANLTNITNNKIKH